MKSFAGMLSHHSLIIGILLMFIFTWLLDLASAGIIHLPIPSFLYTFTGYAAALAALLMTGLTLGRKGVTALLKRFLIWRVGWQWYLVALLLYPAIIFASVLLNAAFSGEPIDQSLHVVVVRAFPVDFPALLAAAKLVVVIADLGRQFAAELYCVAQQVLKQLYQLRLVDPDGRQFAASDFGARLLDAGL